MTDDPDSETLVVHRSPGAHPLLSGRWGTLLLAGPGVLVLLLGVVMTTVWGRSAATIFFGVVIIVTALLAIQSGLGIRRLAVQNRDDPPAAFILSPDGVQVGKKHTSWAQADFRVDVDADPPSVICGGLREVWAISALDATADELAAARRRFAG